MKPGSLAALTILSAILLLSRCTCQPAGAPCTSSRDCLSTEVCAESYCRIVCNSSADCTQGEVCIAGACLPDREQPGQDAALPDRTGPDNRSVDGHSGDRPSPDAGAVDTIVADNAVPDLVPSDAPVADSPTADAGAADSGVTSEAGTDAATTFDGGEPGEVALPVPNWSFELGTPYDPADSWTINGSDGTGGAHPGSEGFVAAAHGDQFHFLNLPEFSGPNPSVTQSDPGLIGSTQPGRYTLTVAVGRRLNNATTDGTVVIELLSDTAVIGAEVVHDPFNQFAAGSWNDVVLVTNVSAGAPELGGDLSIRLSATDGSGGIRSQAQFDAVRLRYLPE